MHRVSIHAVLHDGVAMKDIDWLVVWLTCSLVLYPTDRLGGQHIDFYVWQY